jgi:hypothetical protein
MTRANSPSRFADDIRSPMLVIHGDKDYRVPIGEGLRLWWDLCSAPRTPRRCRTGSCTSRTSTTGC